MTLFVMVKKEHLEGYPLASEEKLDKLAPNDTLVEHAEDKRNKGRNTSPRELFSGMDDYLRVSLLPIERSRTCSYEKESFAWDQCDKKYATIRKLNLHKTGHSSRSFVCSECPKKFAFKSYLVRHQKTHSPSAANLCGKGFRKKRFGWRLIIHKLPNCMYSSEMHGRVLGQCKGRSKTILFSVLINQQITQI